MKKVLFIMLMAGVMMACANPAGEGGNGEEKNPFVGKWIELMRESNGTDNGFIFKDDGQATPVPLQDR